MTLREQELSDTLDVTEHDIMLKAEEHLQDLRELRDRVPEEWDELLRCDTGASIPKMWDFLEMLSKHDWLRSMNGEGEDLDEDEDDDDIDF